MTFLARTYWAGAPFQFRAPPRDAEVESLVLRSADARDIRALYWTPRENPRPRAAVVAMHPRVDFTHHYSFPRFVAAGLGCLGALSRNPNNDMDTEHEALVLDLAACVSFLRSQRDVQTLVLLGNSGGGSLAGLYQSQARLPKAARIARSPGGTRTFLPEAELLPADALVLVSAHRGQGAVLGACIDPSVIDERDPLLTDPSLDMYHPENGFRPPPEWSEYTESFVTRFREAQRARVRRLDAAARAMIEEGRSARARTRERGFEALPLEERQRVERRADFTPVMTIHRTMANLHYTDRRLDPSNREYGSLLSDRPDRMNFELLGFARVCTPRAWLSTWSALSTNADLVKTLPGVREPVLVVHPGRDREIYPRSDAQPIFGAVQSEDRTYLEMPDAKHYFEPDPGDSGSPQVELLMDHVIPWIRSRFDLSPRKAATVAAPRERHPAAASFRFPPVDRPALPGGLRRTNLRELAARPGRFEHHLTIVATIGPAQLEFATASEPTYFAHHNVCDEHALAFPTGDAMVDAAPLRTFLSDPATFEDVGRYNHRAGDLVRHPSNLLHWPGRLRPPYVPFQFPPGMRRTNLVLVYCATGPLAPGPTATFVSAGREADAKAYSPSPPNFVLADTLREAPRTLARVGDTSLELLVSPAALPAPRGGFLVVLESAPDSLHFPGDLIFVPPGEPAPVEGLTRALWLTSDSASPDSPPRVWTETPSAPFPVFEDAPRGALPVSLHGLTIEESSATTVTLRIGAARSAEIPRYWLARMLYRIALHGYRIGYLETYGGFFYDDRGATRLGARGAGHVEIPRDDLPRTIESLYRAVAPDGYVERLV